MLNVVDVWKKIPITKKDEYMFDFMRNEYIDLNKFPVHLLATFVRQTRLYTETEVLDAIVKKSIKDF